MALTVRGLVAIPELGIDLLVEGRDPDRPVTWVHVSELDDPTPFLSGGELLLTTGLGPATRTDAHRFVERLSAADVVGLGFGVGLSSDRVPGELVSAAAAGPARATRGAQGDALHRDQPRGVTRLGR